MKTSSLIVFNCSCLNNGAECTIWLEKVIRRTLMSFVISIIDRQLEAFVPKHVVHNRCVTETALGRFVLKYLLEDNAFILR